MKLAVDKLRKAISNMLIAGYTYDDIMRESGTHNVGRIERGEIAPTRKTWKKLHEAFPDYIPMPELLDGKVVYSPVSNVMKNSSGTQIGRDAIGTSSDNLSDIAKKAIAIAEAYGASDEDWRDFIKTLHEKYL